MTHIASIQPACDAAAAPDIGAPAARTALLAVDTSTDACAVAVCLPWSAEQGAPHATTPLPAAGEALPVPVVRDDIVPGARVVACWRRTGAVSSEALLPMVQAVLDAAGIALPACGAIAFGAGPGSFTGVRTATGAAQGLAFANDMPVVALDTLMVCAESARLRASATPSDRPAGNLAPRHVYAAVDARMGECYAAAFSWRAVPSGAGGAGHDGAGEWHVDIAAHVAAPDAVRPPPADWSVDRHTAVEAGTSHIDGGPRCKSDDHSSGNADFILAGNAATIFGDALCLHALTARHDAAAWPEPWALAALGWRRWRAGAAVAAALAQPHYVRDKVALTTEERLAAKGAKSASKEGTA